MGEEKNLSKGKITINRDDITLMDVDAFVFYARPDLKLGSGLGAAIAIRGGPGVQEQLDKIGGAALTESVITSAGKLKAKRIIHAVGPAFQEKDLEAKLRTTMVNVLKVAEENQVKTLALPAMGSGFYGVPPQLSALVTIDCVKKHLEGTTSLEQVMLCLPDERDYQPFKARLNGSV